MSPFTHREPGVVGAVFDSKDIKAGIIVDGFHCHYASVKIAKKLLGERLYLVTDAASPAGTDMTEFMFEGKRCFHRDGQLRNEDGALAGSVLTMDQGVRNLVEYVGVSLEEALRMASLYPAKAVNIDNRYGKIASGYIADLVILDEKIELMIDEALMAQLDIEPYKKMSTSLLLVIHRQLLTLAQHTGTPVEKMNREFIIENLANVKISNQARERAKATLEKILKS